MSDANDERMAHELALQREKTARALNEKRFALAKAFALERLRSCGTNCTMLGLQSEVRHAVALADALLDELAKPREQKP